MIFAIIKDGIVINVVVASQEFIDAHFKDYTKVSIPESPGSPGIGWIYDGVTFTNPNEAI